MTSHSATSCSDFPRGFLLLVFLLLLSAPPVMSQDLSSVFIVSDAANENYVPGDEATLGAIETVLQRDQSFARQRENLSRYLVPAFSEDGAVEALQLLYRELIKDDQQIISNDGIIEFTTLSRLLDVFERSEVTQDQIISLPIAFKGIGGYSVFSAIRYGKCLELAQLVLDSPDGGLVPDELCDVPRLGKITEYEFTPATVAGEPNPPEGQARFVVSDMKVDSYRVSYDASVGALHFSLEQQWSYIWHVRIKDPGFDEFLRMSQIDYEIARAGNPAVDPFKISLLRSSGAIAHANLPANAKDGLRGDSIWGRGLDRRLFAFGSAVVIEKILGTRFIMLPLDTAIGGEGTYSDIYGKQFIRGEVLEGQDALPDVHPYRQVTPESCIDIMFRGVFPTSKDEFPDDQTGWCLGRCMHPVIENSR